MTTEDEMVLCADGFHSDECPCCGLTTNERDGPANEVISAMNYGDGVAAERARIAAAVKREHQVIREHFGCEPDESVGLPLAAVLAIVNPEETEHD